MVNGLLTAEVAPRRVEYRVRHFGGVFVFGPIQKSQYPSWWLCRKIGVAPQKSLILGSFCTFGGKIFLACGGQGDRDAGAHRAGARADPSFGASVGFGGVLSPPAALRAAILGH